MLQDVRYALRVLLKSPGFALVAILTLALGIASTTAIFSVVDEVLLHPLSYPDADRLVKISETDRSTGEFMDEFSPSNYVDFAARTQAFSFVAASRQWIANFNAGDHPQRLEGAMVSAGFFPLFDVRPLVGRWLQSQDEKAGNHRVVVLGYMLWKREFTSDRNVIGRTMLLNNEPYTIIGVMPEGYSPDESAELWVPSPWGVPTHPLAPNEDPREQRDRHFLDVWGKVKRDATLQQAEVESDSIGKSLAKQFSNMFPNLGIGVMPLQEYLVGNIRLPLLLLFAAVGCVLLISCANVANLLLARATARGKELSIRAALGAGQLRIVRQLLTESIILASLGGTLGVLLAAWAISALRLLSPPQIQLYTHIGVNAEVLGFTLIVSLLSGIIFGIVPAYQASQAKPGESLKEGERGSTAARGGARSVLIIGEVGLCLVLLIASGLLIKSFRRVMDVHPGFETRKILSFNLALPPDASEARQVMFYQQVMDRLKTLGGVQSAGAVNRMPLSNGNSTRSFLIPGSTRTDYEADMRVSTPDYFRAMGIPLLKGRYFESRDDKGPPVILVNETFARKFFPGIDPIGKSITSFGLETTAREIIGIVGNVRHLSLRSLPRAEVYQPLGQATWPSMDVVVRTINADPSVLIPDVQKAVWSVDKNVPLANIRTMQQVLAKSVQRQKFTMLLLSIFGALALFLSAIGLYGVMSYTVSLRTQEIGIRMALGAQKKNVLQLIIGYGMRLTLAGIAIGIVFSLLLSRMISGLLYGVSASDPATFVFIVIFLITISFLANYIPARRAGELNPMQALHHE